MDLSVKILVMILKLFVLYIIWIYVVSRDFLGWKCYRNVILIVLIR